MGSLRTASARVGVTGEAATFKSKRVGSLFVCLPKQKGPAPGHVVTLQSQLGISYVDLDQQARAGSGRRTVTSENIRITSETGLALVEIDRRVFYPAPDGPLRWRNA